MGRRAEKRGEERGREVEKDKRGSETTGMSDKDKREERQRDTERHETHPPVGTGPGQDSWQQRDQRQTEAQETPSGEPQTLGRQAQTSGCCVCLLCLSVRLSV